MRTQLRVAHPTVRRFGAFVNVGGDGNEFAIFVASLLHAIGAHVRLSVGCSSNVTVVGSKPPEVSRWSMSSSAATSDGVHACHMFAEVRLGRNPAKLTPWARTWLTGSRWLGKSYSYRHDREGYVWLNLDWVDSSRVQRPGVPFKAFDTLTTYYPFSLTWEIEGEEFDSAGRARPRITPVESLRMGTR